MRTTGSKTNIVGASRAPITAPMIPIMPYSPVASIRSHSDTERAGFVREREELDEDMEREHAGFAAIGVSRGLTA